MRWTEKETQCFNQGIVVVLSDIDWRTMPETNVILQARDGDWGKWLQERCSELEMIYGTNLYRERPVVEECRRVEAPTKKISRIRRLLHLN